MKVQIERCFIQQGTQLERLEEQGKCGRGGRLEVELTVELYK